MGAGIRSRLVVGFFAVVSLGGLFGAGAVSAHAAGFAQGPGSPFAGPGATGSVALGDLNGDGNADAVVTNPAGGNLVPLLGNGQGALAPGASVPTGGSKPAGVALADLDGDGKLDAAVANNGSHNLSVLLGNGAGGFAPAAKSPVSTDSARPVSVLAGDFNGDRKPDVAVLNNSSADVSILLGDGQGGLTLAGPPEVTGGDHPGSAAAGDFNGDGKLDVAAANESGDVAVLLGDGTGRLSRGAGSPFGLAPAAIGAGDFNSDGKLDVAVANKDGKVTILIGNGTGALSPLPAPVAVIVVGGAPASLVVADVDRDGKLDIAVANAGSGDLSVLLGDGAAGFTPAPGTPVPTGGSSPSSLAVAELNSDGRPDLVAVNAGSANVSVLLNGVAPPIAAFVNSPAAPVPGGVSAITRLPGSSSSQLMAPFPIVRVAGLAVKRGARINELAVIAPVGAKVTVRCSGKGCPFRRWHRTVGPKKLLVKPLQDRFLRTGVTLEVRVYKVGVIGKYTRLVIRKLKPPGRSDFCLKPGSSSPSYCPSS